MKKNGRLFTLALVAAASVIFGMVLAGGIDLTRPARTADPGAEDRPLHAAARAQLAVSQEAPAVIPASFADIAERVNPAVVSITATEKVDASRRGRKSPHGGDPFEFFFSPEKRRPGQEPEEPRLEESEGSGFLVSADGFIVTNYHVVEDASRLTVNLSQDRHDYEAEVIGVDPPTDLALIRIKVENKLPFLTLGDSEAIRVGDWVIAIGNPLAYEHTVTVGVVSAKGRKLYNLSKDFSLDNFIQTDAAINFGNSGGPLVNLAGEVIGVNTAISSVGQGIGFAVPISVAKDIMEQLRTKGKVSRGYLGISLSEITPDIQEAWKLTSDKGALVQDVKPGLPADEAGVRPGDVIVAVDGKRMSAVDEVVRSVSARDPGSTLKLTVLRDGKETILSARLADRSEHLGGAVGSGTPGEPEGEPTETRLGFMVDDLSPQVLQQIGLPRDTKGVYITRVSKVSEAFQKGLEEGVVISELNRSPVANVGDFRREVRKVKAGGLVVLYVTHPPGRAGRDATSRYVTLRLQESKP